MRRVTAVVALGLLAGLPACAQPPAYGSYHGYYGAAVGITGMAIIMPLLSATTAATIADIIMAGTATMVVTITEAIATAEGAFQGHPQGRAQQALGCAARLAHGAGRWLRV